MLRDVAVLHAHTRIPHTQTKPGRSTTERPDSSLSQPRYAARLRLTRWPWLHGWSTRATIGVPSLAVVSSASMSPRSTISITTACPSCEEFVWPFRVFGRSRRAARRLISGHASEPNGVAEAASSTSRMNSFAWGRVSANGCVGVAVGRLVVREAFIGAVACVIACKIGAGCDRGCHSGFRLAG